MADGLIWCMNFYLTPCFQFSTSHQPWLLPLSGALWFAFSMEWIFSFSVEGMLLGPGYVHLIPIFLPPCPIVNFTNILGVQSWVFPYELLWQELACSSLALLKILLFSIHLSLNSWWLYPWSHSHCGCMYTYYLSIAVWWSTLTQLMKTTTITYIPWVLSVRNRGATYLDSTSSWSLRLLSSFQLGLPSKGSNGAEKSISRLLMWWVAGLCFSLVVSQKIRFSYVVISNELLTIQ